MKTILSALLSVLATAALAVPVSAATVDPDSAKLRQAVDELWRAKGAAKPAQAALQARARKSLAKCRSKGRGWKRIRGVKDPAQRRLYTSGARILWNALSDLALERATLTPLRGAMGRYVNRLEAAGIADPVLKAGVAAQRRRLAIQDTLVPLGTCKTFEARVRKVHAVRRKGLAQAQFDSRAGAVYAAMARYIQKKQNAAERQFAGPLESSYDRLKALGATEGEANGFLYALSLGH
jgi:hypothetical protein